MFRVFLYFLFFVGFFHYLITFFCAGLIHNQYEMEKTATFIRLNQAAEICGVRPETMYQWLRKGIVKGYKHPGGKFWLFDANELREVMNNVKN